MFLQTILLILISLLSFLLPTQLGLHLNSLSTTVYGFKIDYLVPTIYLTDIIVFLVIALSIKKVHLKPKNIYIAILLVLFAAANVYISSYPVPALYKWIKVFEMLLLAIVILNTKKFNVLNNFIIPLSLSVLLVSLLGIIQFFLKGSLGGLFYFLGERNFTFSNPNVSPYPYATFSHPNSFAGFILVFEILFIQYKKNIKNGYFWLVSLLVLTNLILTNSLNVYLTIAILILFYLKRNLFLSFFSIDLGARFITHRIELINASLKMIKQHFLLGVGLNNFIPTLVKVSNTFINSWELQPVHNIFLLVFSETGVIGLLLFCFVVFSSFQFTTSPLALIAILFTGLNDHYWLTLQQNILLFVFVLIIMRKNK